jgi:hypothetical protein
MLRIGTELSVLNLHEVSPSRGLARWASARQTLATLTSSGIGSIHRLHHTGKTAESDAEPASHVEAEGA